MKVYTVELWGGHIGLVTAETLKKAKCEAIDEEGKNNVSDVRLATEEEIEWVRAMGGYVPKLSK